MAQEQLSADWAPETVEKLFSRFISIEECWAWTYRPANTGYAQISLKSDGEWVVKSPHRMIYELLVGEIPEGKQLDHLCRNRLCVNPEHLEPVTQKENLLRGSGWAGVNSRKTECPSGHEYTEENTQLNKEGHRKCKTCSYARKKTWRNNMRKQGKRYS